MKKRPPYNQNAMIRGAIRRTFSRSPIVREVLMEGRREIPRFNKDGSRAKKDAVQYQCQVCSTWTGSTMVAVDHINPVVSTETGFVDWNTFVDRLFCDKTNLQRICDTCHDQKTAQERFQRNLLKDMEELGHQESGLRTNEERKKWLKRFTKKKLINSNYPIDIQDRIRALRLKMGMKV